MNNEKVNFIENQHTYRIPPEYKYSPIIVRQCIHCTVVHICTPTTIQYIKCVGNATTITETEPECTYLQPIQKRKSVRKKRSNT